MEDAYIAMVTAFSEWQSHHPHSEWVKEQVIVIEGEYKRGSVLYTKGKKFVEPAHWDGKCCPGEHFQSETLRLRDPKTGQELVSDRHTAKPDDQVCDRERAWRKYVKLRDAYRRSTMI